jgi:hypothetical protein
MNLDRILQLADFIEKMPEHAFDMRQIDPLIPETLINAAPILKAQHCRSPGCVSGWCAVLFGGGVHHALNVNAQVSRDLVMPPDWLDRARSRQYTREEAAWTLRNLAKTGKVVWRV